MSVESPLVSVGVPVFNGEATLDRALGALVRQSYQNLEIVIGDNGSEDRTEEICRRFAASEPRCTYVRSPVNRGAAENFGDLFRRSSGSLFMWTAADDELDPLFVESGVEYLKQNPAVVLAAPQVRGYVPWLHEPVSTVEANGLGRDVQGFRRVVRSYTRLPMVSIYGLFRSDVITASELMKPKVAGDVAFMQEIALRGPIETNPAQILHYRNSAAWNTSGDDRQVYLGGVDRRFPCRIGRRVPGGLGLSLLSDRLSRVRSLRDGPLNRAAMVSVILALEVRRVFLMLIIRTARVLVGRSLRHRLAVNIYWRFFHSKDDVDIHDRAVFVDRFVLPRFAPDRDGPV